MLGLSVKLQGRLCPHARLFSLPAMLLLAAIVQGAPVIRDVQPHGVQRGKTFTLYLRGEGLAQGAQVKSTLPASFSQLTLSKDPLSEQARPNTVLPYMVTLKA